MFAAVYLVVLLLLQLLLLIQCQVQLGSTLTAGKGKQVFTTSPNSTFSAGFTSDADHAGLYNFAVWYTDVKPRTVVWRAMNNETGGVSVLLHSGDQLVFQVDGRLVLTSTPGIIWGTYTSTEDVTGAALGEDGNLMILSKSQTVWMSFGHPTDTILPNQQLIGSTRLVSSNSKYFLMMEISRVAMFYRGYWLEPYWSIQNSEIGQSLKPNEYPRLNMSSEGLLSFFDGYGTSWTNPTKISDSAQLHATDYPNHVTRRLTLDDDGNLRMYTLNDQKSSWTISWQAILLDCEIFGRCGRFGICSYRPTSTCTCPPGFRPTNASDPSQDCMYNIPLPEQSCHSNSSASNSTRLIRLSRTDFMYNDYNSHPLPLPTSEQDCISKCLGDCRCLGAAYEISGTGMCWLKGLDPSGLLHGKQSLDIPNVFFIKVSSKELARSPDENEYVADANATVVPGFQWRLEHRSFFKNQTQAGLFVGLIVLLVAVMLTGVYVWRMMRKQHERIAGFDGGPISYTYHQLQAFTGNFKEKLGSGGFGSVYKGKLSDGTDIAVKEIEKGIDIEAEKQFQAEVRTIGKIHHINLVHLLGYCYEDTHKLLVYEFMPNGSLEKLLFRKGDDVFAEHFCSWESRYKVALGIARGIKYLHEDCHECIVHCDIKPQNILLDTEFCPKVADFGMAKLVKRRQRSFSVTTVRGTRGYLAPEWIDNQPITSKVDVYSFGMVLLEILSGRDMFVFTPSAMNSETDRWNLPYWAFQRYHALGMDSIIDKNIEGNIVWEQFERFLKVAFWCIQHDPSVRPHMSQVVQMLEGNIPVVDPPKFAYETDTSYH